MVESLEKHRKLNKARIKRFSHNKSTLQDGLVAVRIKRSARPYGAQESLTCSRTRACLLKISTIRAVESTLLGDTLVYSWPRAPTYLRHRNVFAEPLTGCSEGYWSCRFVCGTLAALHRGDIFSTEFIVSVREGKYRLTQQRGTEQIKIAHNQEGLYKVDHEILVQDDGSELNLKTRIGGHWERASYGWNGV